ncbi:D-arginine dehydrogenase [Rhizobiales bacterium GAS188]|nr:D-arginine dehydrogenase [Rhizobiales bacterium GAS188]
MHARFDFAVIGGGVAGLSVASGLAAHGRVVLLEREPELARHASGRSVAMFSAHSGNPVMRALTRASRPFFETPPPWHDRPLLTLRGLLVVAPPEQLPALARQSAEGRAEAQPWRELDGTGAASVMPILDAKRIAGALYDPAARQIEVNGLITGYRRVLAAGGGEIAVGADVAALEHRNGHWRLTGRNLDVAAGSVVNAGGAWADEVAARAGLPPVGITPRRRSVAVVAAPSDVSVDGPMTADAARRFYFRPAPGTGEVELLMSPCDETRAQPGDAQPGPADVDAVRGRVEELCCPDAGLAGRPVRRAWAGLRSFAPDELPVVGFDPAASGFFWLAGQGGHGIQAAPALADLAVGLILERPPAAHLAAHAIDATALAPRRFAGVTVGFRDT